MLFKCNNSLKYDRKICKRCPFKIGLMILKYNSDYSFMSPEFIIKRESKCKPEYVRIKILGEKLTFSMP